MALDYYERQEYSNICKLECDDRQVVTPEEFCARLPEMEKRFSEQEERFFCSSPLQQELNELHLESRPFWVLFLYVNDEVCRLIHRRVDYAPETVGHVLQEMETGRTEITVNGQKIKMDQELFRRFLRAEESASPALHKWCGRRIIRSITQSTSELRVLRIKKFVELLDVFFLKVRGLKRSPWRIYARLLSLSGLLNLDIFLSKFPPAVRVQERKMLDGVGKYISHIIEKA